MSHHESSWVIMSRHDWWVSLGHNIQYKLYCIVNMIWWYPNFKRPSNSKNVILKRFWPSYSMGSKFYWTVPYECTTINARQYDDTQLSFVVLFGFYYSLQANLTAITIPLFIIIKPKLTINPYPWIVDRKSTNTLEFLS